MMGRIDWRVRFGAWLVACVLTAPIWPVGLVLAVGLRAYHAIVGALYRAVRAPWRGLTAAWRAGRAAEETQDERDARRRKATLRRMLRRAKR
jgi:hypothetical protein